MGNYFSAADGGSVGLYMDDKPTFDTHNGFETKRKERVMIAKDEDLISARIPPKYRDYCAHLLLDYQVCRSREMPLLYRCGHEKHIYLTCEHEDYVIRMKEFEREKRLRQREQRVATAA